MCIRDRGVLIGTSVVFLLPAIIATWVFAGTLDFRPGGILGCLLYTSDAADERSSVDLGGRRIIKKKKHSVLTVSQDKTKMIEIVYTKK